MPDLPPDSKRPSPRPSANAVVAAPDGAKLLSFGETAFELRVSLTTIRRLVDGGQLRATKIMGRTFVARVAINDFLHAADVARKPASEATAYLSAQRKVQTEQRLRTQVKADWSKGEKQIDLEKVEARLAERAARKQAKQSST